MKIGNKDDIDWRRGLILNEINLHRFVQVYFQTDVIIAIPDGLVAPRKIGLPGGLCTRQYPLK